MAQERRLSALNIQGFIKNGTRLCDNYFCNHQLNEHTNTGKCTQCGCKEILFRRDAIALNV